LSHVVNPWASLRKGVTAFVFSKLCTRFGQVPEARRVLTLDKSSENWK